jgi:predicted RNA methylase
MDWSKWNIDILLNSSLNNEENNYKIEYSNSREIIENSDYQIKITDSNKYLLWLITDTDFLLRTNIFTGNAINRRQDIINKLNIINVNDIHFLNGITYIPLTSDDIKYNIYEYYSLLERANVKLINKSAKSVNPIDTIFINNDVRNKFEKSIRYINNNIVINKTTNGNTNNNTNNNDIYICSANDKYSMLNCNWFYFYFIYFYNQLHIIAKTCKNNATCIISYDYRFLKMPIHIQILTLYSCFMNITLYHNNTMTFGKCYIIGTNLDLKKLQKFTETNKIINEDENDDVLININTKCKYKHIHIDSLNLTCNFERVLIEIYNKFISYQNLRIKYINSLKLNNSEIINKNINKTLRYTINSTYNIISKYPFKINEYYLDNPKKVTFSICELNKKYFPNIKNVDFNKLELTLSALYSVTYPDAAILINKIIFDLIGYNTILDATSNCGGNTISFANIFKNVISIELDKQNYNCLKHNVEQYGFKNVEVILNDCLVYLKEIDYKIDNIFFDPPWGGTLSSNKKEVILKLSDIDMDTIIKTIFKFNIKAKVFMKVPSNYVCGIPHITYPIKNYYLLYFTA